MPYSLVGLSSQRSRALGQNSRRRLGQGHKMKWLVVVGEMHTNAEWEHTRRGFGVPPSREQWNDIRSSASSPCTRQAWRHERCRRQ